MINPAVQAYFDRIYPPRRSNHVKVFRCGDAARVELLREWLRGATGRSLLDVGCGDGECLHNALTERPRLIRLEDISAAALSAAAASMDLPGTAIVTANVDGFSERSGPFDIVQAIGVLDYHDDVQAGLRTLIGRCRDTVIVTFPRADHPRNWVRFLWLAVHGVRLQLVTRRRLYRLLRRVGRPFDVACGPYEHVVRIHIQ